MKNGCKNKCCVYNFVVCVCVYVCMCINIDIHTCIQTRTHLFYFPTNYFMLSVYGFVNFRTQIKMMAPQLWRDMRMSLRMPRLTAAQQTLEQRVRLRGLNRKTFRVNLLYQRSIKKKVSRSRWCLQVLPELDIVFGFCL